MGDDLFSQINKVKDPGNPTDLEKKHHPVITAPDKVKAGECFEVTVEVGKLLTHPNENGHFIEFIDLYADHIYIARLDLTPVTTCPTLKVCVNLREGTSSIKALTRCNLHGTWEGQSEIEVAG